MGTEPRPPAERHHRRPVHEAGLEHDPELLSAYYEFWVPHTETDPEVRPLWEWLRSEGIKVGVLSNTVWPREWHVGFFERDGVAHLLDGDVYTSEIPWTKPSPRRLRRGDGRGRRERPGALRLRRRPAVRRRVGRAQRRHARDPHPAPAIPVEQVGHTEGEPDAVAHRLADIPDDRRAWR